MRFIHVPPSKTHWFISLQPREQTRGAVSKFKSAPQKWFNQHVLQNLNWRQREPNQLKLLPRSPRDYDIRKPAILGVPQRRGRRAWGFRTSQNSEELSPQSAKKLGVMWAGLNWPTRNNKVWIRTQREPIVTPSILSSVSLSKMSKLRSKSVTTRIGPIHTKCRDWPHLIKNLCTGWWKHTHLWALGKQVSPVQSSPAQCFLWEDHSASRDGGSIPETSHTSRRWQSSIKPPKVNDHIDS